MIQEQPGINNKILCIMPSRNRPESCLLAATSLINNISAPLHLVILLDFDDPSLPRYLESKELLPCYHITSPATITARINEIAMRNIGEYDFFHLTNDDTIYRTKGWDTQFISATSQHGVGVYYGNDMFQGINMPTFPFIPSSLVKEVGWLQMPHLIRYFGDTTWQFLAIEMGRKLFYLPDVVIEHMHKLAGKGNDDVDMDIFEHDKLEFAKFVVSSQPLRERLRGKYATTG